MSIWFTLDKRFHVNAEDENHCKKLEEPTTVKIKKGGRTDQSFSIYSYATLFGWTVEKTVKNLPSAIFDYI